MPEVTFRYNPWPHQKASFQALDEGQKRLILLWPRRHGKDLTAFNGLLRKALQRVGSYYHFFPTLKLGKKILWNGMDAEGVKYIDYVPPELIRSISHSDLKIELVNGSLIQVMSVENINKSAIGTNCLGAVFSEFAAYDTEESWNLVRPILAANDGFAIFAYTPRGHNHGYKLYEHGKREPEWFTSYYTSDQTFKHDGSPVVSQATIDADRRSGMPEELISQEYYCSFEGFMQGGFFSEQFEEAKLRDRFTRIPYDPYRPVDTVCDLGVGLNFAAWLFQVYDNKINIIEFYNSHTGSITDFARYVHGLPYTYGNHYAPWDANKPNEEAGIRRCDTAYQLGIPFIVLPKLAVEERINAGRLIFKYCYFDQEHCRDGLIHLQNYRRKWNERLQQYENRELHDKHSHGGSAFSYLGVACRDKVMRVPTLPKTATMAFTPYDLAKTAEVELPNHWTYQ